MIPNYWTSFSGKTVKYQLLVGYETGKEKPHAESSYMLYPANPDRQDPVYTFIPCSANNR
ncbi:hypothetical protein NXW38_08555 [Bacteroides ovatus]|nr:hypothetical protein [Bacteroides ovatus]